MFDTVLGLPVHVLVVHAVVVGLPLMAVVTAVAAFMPTLRLWFAWAIVVARRRRGGPHLRGPRERRAAAAAARRAGRPGARRPRAEPDLVRAVRVRRRRGGGPDPRLPPARPRHRGRRGSAWWRRCSRSGGPSGSATAVPRPSGRASSRAPTSSRSVLGLGGAGAQQPAQGLQPGAAGRPGPSGPTQASSPHSGSSWVQPRGQLGGARSRSGKAEMIRAGCTCASPNERTPGVSMTQPSAAGQPQRDAPRTRCAARGR